MLELTVRVGAEDGLGTPLLVHWAGAQLQVPAHRALGFSELLAWARRCWCTGPARSCRCLACHTLISCSCAHFM